MNPEENLEEEIVVVDDEINSQGEIDSTEDDEKLKKQQKTPRKRGNDTQKRISELWMKRKEAEEEAQRATTAVVHERAKNHEYEKITAAALEENLNTKRELLTERLTRANEAEDKKAAATITAELSKVEAQAAQMERYKIESQVNGKAPPAQPQQQRQDTQRSAEDIYDSMSPSGKKWMDENRDWYEAEGENHDPEKSADVTYYAQTLEQEYRAAGKGAQIGTRAYFKEIDDYIKKNWEEDVVEENEEEAPKREQKKILAAPVNRSQAPSQTQRKEYKITQAEKEMALSSDTKGKDGKPLSDTDKIKRFISLRESVPTAGPISMQTMRKGV